MRARYFIASLAVGAFVLTACGGEPERQDDPVITSPGTPRDTDPEDVLEDEAVIEGTLGGDAQLEGGCAWLDTPAGRYEVLWPSGYEVLFDPVRLIGPSGDVVAEAGDTLRVEGRTATDMMSICMVGILYQAENVQAV